MTGREKFEDWFEEYTGWETDEYPNQDVVHACFEAWQAALDSQQPADDGWIEWAGGECPVNINSLVNVRYRNGGGDLDSKPAEVYNWSHNDEDCYPIIAYRVVKP